MKHLLDERNIFRQFDQNIIIQLETVTGKKNFRSKDNINYNNDHL